MRILKSSFIVFFILSVVVSCNDTDELSLSNDDYLIFGHYYGHCVGEGCVETYKLTNSQLFEDTTDSYAGVNPFNFVALSNDQFNEVKDLIEYFPMDLLNQKEGTFGCPDCADQGGILIIYSKNGVTKTWRLDQSKNDVPNYLHSFMDTINKAINTINN